MTSFPFAQLSEIQIYPLADLRKSLDRASEAFQAMAAGM
jgi:hypothetical protein